MSLIEFVGVNNRPIFIRSEVIIGCQGRNNVPREDNAPKEDPETIIYVMCGSGSEDWIVKESVEHVKAKIDV